jgi:hypothetical protein
MKQDRKARASGTVQNELFETPPTWIQPDASFLKMDRVRDSSPKSV